MFPQLDRDPETLTIHYLSNGNQVCTRFLVESWETQSHSKSNENWDTHALIVALDYGKAIPKFWTKMDRVSAPKQVGDTKMYGTLFGQKSDDQAYHLVLLALLNATEVSVSKTELPTLRYESRKVVLQRGCRRRSGQANHVCNTSMCSASNIQPVCELWSRKTYTIARSEWMKSTLFSNRSSALFFVFQKVLKILHVLIFIVGNSTCQLGLVILSLSPHIYKLEVQNDPIIMDYINKSMITMKNYKLF